MSLDNVVGTAAHAATTHGTILEDNGIANALSTTVASTGDSIGVSATIFAANANATILSDAANVTSPKKGKQRNKQHSLKILMTTTKILKVALHHPLVAIQSARMIWMMLLLIPFPPILQKLRIMCQVMSATGHKQSCPTTLNLHRRTDSMLIAKDLFITCVLSWPPEGEGRLSIIRTTKSPNSYPPHPRY